MNFRNISAWSIRNPVVPIVFFIGLVIAGVVSFMRMDIQQMPDIEFPMVIINVSQPGAAPSEIKTQITQRVEAAVRSISGVSTISSTAKEGSSQTFVEFELGEDINGAVSEVKNAIDQVRGELPDGILEPQIFKASTSSDPMAYFSVIADDMTMEQVSWFIDDTVAKRLLSIDGMAEVKRFGGVDREILVTLDPARMQALGVTAGQVNRVLRQLNVDAAGGRAEIGGTRQSVRVLGGAKNAYELSQTDISLGAGRSVKLADIARVTDAFGEISSIAKTDGRPVVTFGISRSRGASDVSVYDAAIADLAEMEKEYPGVSFKQNFTIVNYTKAQYESSMAAMVEGAILAVIVVFFFLRDWRATVIAAIAIPLSAIPTFWFMDLLGFTLNTQSLLALSLVAGVLVDDAIVEIENIVRHMRMGKTAYQAAIDAADEIGLAVVATTFSIVAVFLPVGLMPGVSGEIFRAFGLTVVVAVLMSLAVARTISPMVAAYFLKAHGEAEHASGKWMDLYLKVLHWSLDTSKADAYRAEHRQDNGRIPVWHRLKARFRDHRVRMMGVGVVSLVVTGLVASTMPMEFFPTQDNDFTSVRIEMVPGTTIEQTEAVSDRVRQIMFEQPETAGVFQRVFEGGGFLMISLKDEREKTSKQFENALTPVLQDIPDARVAFQDPDSGRGSGTGRPISVMLTGSDSKVLEETAARLVEEMKGLKQIIAPRISADMRRPEIVIKPRLDLAAQLGVTTAALSEAIRIATIGEIDQNAAKFSLTDRQVPIRVRLPETARDDLNNIANLPVPTSSGGSVPLSRVAEISLGSGPTTIQRYNQETRIFIGADLAPGIVKSEATEAINQLPIMQNLPTGVSNKPFGQDEWQQEMLNNLSVAVPSGILLVFAVLVLLYHRIISPLVNMGSLFLAPLGGILALFLTGQALSMPVFIGILMLLGIVGKNSILLIDFAIEEMAQGASKFDAIVEAGHKRAQPIVMTTVAMTAGMVPTALSLSGDGAWRAPMGTVVIGGLLVSTLLTLVIVPAAFSLADGLEKRIGPKLRRSLLTFEPEHAVAERRRRRDDDDGAFPAE
ncbi:MAG: efflux RND transporter permease subunit [Novosphingobium sp.]|nr:efflux RND transporter permease subunit [Novosphingobium sp.]MCP5401906.1 efflux RND transporter permease subunit [Novosphingobium sp.]